MNPTREQIESAIREDAATYRMDADRLMRQCATESSFNPCAINGTSGCYGLFQLAAATAKELGVDRADWRQNVRGGVKYMARLSAHYDGDYAKALAAYNWGLGHLAKLMAAHPSDWRDHLPAETKGYLTKILG